MSKLSSTSMLVTGLRGCKSNWVAGEAFAHESVKLFSLASTLTTSTARGIVQVRRSSALDIGTCTLRAKACGTHRGVRCAGYDGPRCVGGR